MSFGASMRRAYRLADEADHAIVGWTEHRLADHDGKHDSDCDLCGVLLAEFKFHHGRFMRARDSALEA